MTLFNYLISVFILLLKPNIGCSYITGYSNGALDACHSVVDEYQSYEYKCYTNTVYIVKYWPSIYCNGTLYSNTTTSIVCESTLDICHHMSYIDYNSLDSQNTLECSYLPQISNDIRVINKCIPYLSYYTLFQCTNNMIINSYYLHSNCTGEILKIFKTNKCTETSGEYFSIQSCNEAINTIDDDCGYIQFSEWIYPLSQCIIEEQLSLMFQCNDDEPILHYWFSSGCKTNMQSDGNLTMNEMSFVKSYSCGTKQCEYAVITQYNVDDCGSDLTAITSTKIGQKPVIVDQCINIYDNTHDNLSMSTKFVCNQSSVTQYWFNGINCKSSIISSYVNKEDCMNETNSYYYTEIYCNQTTTQISYSTTFYTSEATESEETTTALAEFTEPLSTDDEYQSSLLAVYVSTDGVDVDGCGLSLSPCGSLLFASEQCSLYSYDHIIVHGQNKEWIQARLIQERVSNNEVSRNPCLPLAISDDSYLYLTITFEDISSMNEWYPTSLCESVFNRYENTSFFAVENIESFGELVLNNVVFDSYSFEGRSNQPTYIIAASGYITVTCNDCVFRNIIIHSDHRSHNGKYESLIVGSNLEFDSCIFNNVHYVASSSVTDFDPHDYSFIRLYNFYDEAVTNNMNHLIVYECDISDIHLLHSFLYLEPYWYAAHNFDITDGSMTNITHSSKSYIHNSDFTNISTSHSIIYNKPWSESSVDLQNVEFVGVYMGSVLHSLGSVCTISMANIFISTSQTIDDYHYRTQQHTGTTDDHYSLIILDSTSDEVDINTITVQYDYAENFWSYCWTYDDVYTWSTIQHYLIDAGFWLFRYYCSLPIQFIDSSSILNITDMTVITDMNARITEQYRDNIINTIYSQTSKPHDTIFIQFAWYPYSQYDDTYSHHAVIKNNGILNIDGLFVNAGVHQQIIYSPDGQITVNNMISVYDNYCTDSVSCAYNPNYLQNGYWITFGEETSSCAPQLTITNSVFYGNSRVAIEIKSGSAYITNITLQYGTMGIWVNDNVEYFQMLHSNIFDIGKYYGPYSSVLNAMDPLYLPLWFDAAEIVIKHCEFAYIDPYLWYMFQNDFADEPKYKIITLSHNIFTIRDINVLYPYPINVSLHTIIAATENTTTNLDFYFLVSGAMVISEKMKISVIRNTFTVHPNNRYVSESVIASERFPMIHMDSTEVDSCCMSGNTFSGYAINISNGNINSCVRSFTTGNNCSYYHTFSNIDKNAWTENDNHKNVFYINNIASLPVITVANNATISLENSRIDVDILDNNITANIFNVDGGVYSFIDLHINSSTTYDFRISTDCIPKCYSVFNISYTNIAALFISCTDEQYNNYNSSYISLDDHYTPQSSTSFAPLFISLIPKNTDYFPGSKLKFGYKITDQYNNTIDTPPKDITLKFGSYSLLIESNGDCQACISGILLSLVNLDMIGDNITYSVTAAASESYLIVMNDAITINIVECMSGYGATDTNQCNSCLQGYIALSANKEPCNWCNTDQNAYQCLGLNNLSVNYGYIVHVFGFHPLNESYFDESIISGKCPPKYCCQNSNGCDYLFNNDSLCTANRDPDVLLCGRCAYGYSEMYGSTSCAICTDKTQSSLIFVAILYGFLWALFIVATKSSSLPNDTVEENESCCECWSKCKSSMTDCCKACKDKLADCCKKGKDSNSNRNSNKNDSKPNMMSKEEYFNSIEVIATKVFVYYFQSLAYLFTTNVMKVSFAQVLYVFDLNIFEMMSGSDAGYCLLSNMSTKQKILMPLTVTGSVTASIVIIWVFSFYEINVLKCCKRIPHFGQVAIKAYLVCIGQILSVLFQLLACRKVGNVEVHFYFGSEQCHHNWWIASLCALLLLIVSFLILILRTRYKRKLFWTNDGDVTMDKLYEDCNVMMWTNDRDEIIIGASNSMYTIETGDTKNADYLCVHHKTQNNEAYYPMIWCYNDSYWWWEAVLFGRRLMLAYTLIVIDSQNVKVVISAVLIIYAFIHNEVQPFKSTYVNLVESYVVFGTAFAILVSLQYENITNVTVFDVMIVLLIILPILWLCLYIFTKWSSVKKESTSHKHSDYLYDIVYDEDDETDTDPCIQLSELTVAANGDNVAKYSDDKPLTNTDDWKEKEPRSRIIMN